MNQREGRVLVLGGSGLLGRDLVPYLCRNGWDVQAPSHSELDAFQVGKDLLSHFDVLVNCVAYTNVDRAESEQLEAFHLNSELPYRLAKSADAAGCRMIHISTDYVFDGRKYSPYVETDPTLPLSIYGQTKRYGESSVLRYPANSVLRTSWLYGVGRCFPSTILDRWEAGNPLRVVENVYGTPTYTRDLAQAIEQVARKKTSGLFHAAGPRIMSRKEFAERLLWLWTGEKIQIEGGFEVQGIRPLRSPLSSNKLASRGIRLEDGLERYIERIKKRQGNG